MAHPKSRISKQRKRKRRTHYKIDNPPHVLECSNCGGHVLRHRICGACGSYRGRTIINKEEAIVAVDTETTIDDVQVED